MICSGCGKEISNDAKFCPFCGKVSNVMTQTKKKNKFSLDKQQMIIICSLLLVVVIMLMGMLLFKEGNKRTVMIYVVGSNLETDAKIVTADLNAIDPSKIDLKNTNILLYTGGTKKWHNFISNEDNGIYILKEKGFEKLESQEQFNLGDPKTLSDFLRYGYNNYKADKYDLILYDHGGAIDGAIYDDLSGDNLSLEDMSKALSDSPFNSRNKMDAVVFRTCLNGTLELANIFKDYSNYLIGSEEVSYGASSTNVLGFLNDVVPQDKGNSFGKKFVDAYENQMNILNPFDDTVQTYSVIDLSKINALNEEFNNYIKEIDISKNFRNISLIRSNLYEYGAESSSGYDMIDLYEFVSKTSSYTKSGGDKVLSLINEAVSYNKSNRENNHGMSIYFPYSGKKGIKFKFLEVYDNLNFLGDYKKFIKTFNKMQQSPSGYSFSLNNNKINSKEEKGDFSIELTDEQKENFSIGLFAIFERDSQHPNYYMPIFSSDNTVLDGNVLMAKVDNQMLKIMDDDGVNSHYLFSVYRKNNKNVRTIQGAILYAKNLTLGDDGWINNVIMSVSNKSDEPFVSSIRLKSKNEKIDGILLKIDDYDKYEIWNNSYKILDENGNYTSEWEASPVMSGYEGKMNELKLINSELEKGDNYYGVFILYDIYENVSYSKLIKIGG